tara:strand:- start:253 stop:432 length:180 start_codon:yes stop_codon:yes gene_type:complete
MLGTTELIVIGLIIFVLFGASAIPKFAKSLGQAKSSFEDGVKSVKKDDEKESIKDQPAA